MPTLADCWRSAPGAFEQWLGAAIAALLGAAALYSTGPDLALQRGLVFVGGPLLWLSGLAPRLGEYLHAPARLRLLPLPLPALEHWRASAAIRRRGAALTALAGAVAIAVGTASHLPTREVAGLVGDWLWLSVVVVLVEPWAPAVAAWLGRRMPAESTAQRLQSGLAGGWTLPEASVHLYAPPLVLGLATALAIPGQLWLDLSIDGASPPSAVLVVAVAGPGLALGLRPWAASVYGRGMFEAVPWLAQATRTLAGPPVPSPLPGFVSRLRAPALRLLAMQLWRTTPVPGLRMWTLLLVAAWVGLVAGPTLPRVTVVAALALAWLVPTVRVLTRLAPSRAAALGPSARPLAPSWGWTLVLAPVLVAAALVVVGIARAA